MKFSFQRSALRNVTIKFGGLNLASVNLWCFELRRKSDLFTMYLYSFWQEKGFLSCQMQRSGSKQKSKTSSLKQSTAFHKSVATAEEIRFLLDYRLPDLFKTRLFFFTAFDCKGWNVFILHMHLYRVAHILLLAESVSECNW